MIAADEVGGSKHQRIKPGYGGDGSFTDCAKATPLPVSGDLHSRIMIASGEITGLTSVQKFGMNTDIDAGVPEDVWDGGGLYSWPTSASQMEVLSASGLDDSPAGTGARTVNIQGLDASYAQVNETVTLSGVTPVGTANTYIRVFRMKVLSAGSLEQNAGILTCRPLGGGTTVAQINAGQNQTNMALYTVPAGKTGFISKIFTSATDNQTKGFSVFEMRVREFGQVFAVKYNVALVADGTTCFNREFDCPIEAGEKADIKFTGQSSANNTIMVAAFDITLKDD